MLTPSQQQAVNAPTHSALIANAGSGKTHTLVQKYLHALETNPDLSNSAIIAITFTDNAAAENNLPSILALAAIEYSRLPRRHRSLRRIKPRLNGFRRITG